jgi:hypothetical protein
MPIKEQIDSIKDRSIDFFNVVFNTFNKTSSSTNTNILISDPCVSEVTNSGVADPSTYYIAGLLFLIVLGTITTVLIVLDHQPDIE